MRGLTYARQSRATTRLLDVHLRGGCIGPINSFFALAPRRERGRIGPGSSSDDIADVVSSNNPLQLGAEGLTVSGTDAPLIDQTAALTPSPNISLVVEWTGMTLTNAVRTIFRAESTGDLQYAQLIVNAANALIFDVNGTTISLGSGADDGGTHRVAATYDASGNIAASFDGAAVVTGVGAVEPANIDQFWIGNNNGTTQCGCALRAPFFGLSFEMTPAQLVDASDLTTVFICRQFPAAMALGAFNDGFSSGFTI